MLEDLARRARLAPECADEVEVPYEFPDGATLERALLAFAPIYRIGPEVAEVARLAAEADDVGWHGVFVWDHVHWRESRWPTPGSR